LRFFSFRRSLSPAVLFIFCALASLRAATPLGETIKLLPDTLAGARAVKNAETIDARPNSLPASITPENFHVASAASRSYAATGQNGAFTATIFQTRHESAAYALFSAFRATLPSEARQTTFGDPGTASVSVPGGGAAFYQGTSFVIVSGSSSEVAAVARALAQNLDAGEGEIPVLVKHLPDWEQVESRALYAVSAAELQKIAGAEGEYFGKLDFAGGTEAVVAPYRNASRLIVVEHHTPQLATTNQTLAEQTLQSFRQEGKAVPSAYRRVGNYLVFVLGEPDAQAADALIGQVNYEQLVRWLGDNPRAFENLQKNFP
jgi:hypothetical protein